MEGFLEMCACRSTLGLEGKRVADVVGHLNKRHRNHRNRSSCKPLGSSQSMLWNRFQDRQSRLMSTNVGKRVSELSRGLQLLQALGIWLWFGYESTEYTSKIPHGTLHAEHVFQRSINWKSPSKRVAAPLHVAISWPGRKIRTPQFFI
jgi:hypothetical protein